MTVFRLLFWIWFIASIGVLVVRTSNKRSGAVAQPVNGQLTLLDSLLGKKLPESGGADSTSLGRSPTTSALLGLDPTASVPPASRPPATPASPLAEGSRPAEGATRPGDGGARQGLFANGDAEPGPSAAPGPQVATVAEALHGMSWPCGLTPVIDLAAQHAADRQVTFWTADAGAGEVGRRLGDALEGQGYALRSTSDTVVEARRDGAALEVRLHPEAGKAERNGAPAYPSLPPRAVVAVFTLLAG
jgi:hypothetical protein